MEIFSFTPFIHLNDEKLISFEELNKKLVKANKHAFL
jgi:hypothetical protein